MNSKERRAIERQDKQPSVAAQQIVHEEQIQVSRTSGPIPDPLTLKQYNEVHPGASEIILSAFQSQGSHRQAMEVRVVDAQIADGRAARMEARLGQIFAFILSLVMMSLGTWVIMAGHEYTGATVTLFPVIGLASVFIYGRKGKTGESIKPPK